MKGLDLSRLYYEKIVLPCLEKEAREYMQYMAIGLVGEGSECFLLDDEVSRDHDFGPGVCIWLPEHFYLEAGDKISKVIEKLPVEFMGYKREELALSDKRIGVFSIEEFYYKYTKQKIFPISEQAWLEIPESFLATCTNGEVFLDNYGEFSKIRSYLLDFYPDNILKKKLATYLSHMAQSGQYNYARSYKRKDLEAMYFSKYEFISNTYGALFLLARSYKPYYKLQARKLASLNYYPKELLEDLRILLISNDFQTCNELIERICKYLVDILRIRYGLETKDSFLIAHALELQSKITNRNIRELHIMKGN